MPDLKQALKDFVATSNSGKYTDEATLLSKFPELEGYDIQTLRDFVATSNSGKYATEEEVFSKFPEFNVQGELVKKDYKGLMGISADIELKKKEQTTPLEPQLATQQPTTPQSPMALPSEDSFLASQKQLPKFETTPLGYKYPIPSSKSERSIEFLDPLLQGITPELINKNEEFVVPKMNYNFGDLGFKFEESGATGDWMTATAPNGKKIEISLDPLFSSKAESESEKLKSFIKENSKGISGLSEIAKRYSEENKKFDTQKEVDDSIKQINNDATALNQVMASFLKQKKQLEAQFAELSNTPKNLRNTPEYIAKSQAVSKAQEELESKRRFVLANQKNIESRNKSLEKAVGRYTEMKSEQWAWYEVPLKSLAKGVGSLASGFYGASIDVINNYAPKGMLMSPEKWTSESLRIAKKLGLGEPSVGQSEDKWLNSLSQTEKDKIESQVRDSLKKRDKNMLVGGEAQDPAYIKSKYIELAEKEGIEGPKSDSKEDYNKWLNTISDSKKQEFDAVITEESIGGVTISNLIRNSVSNQLPINTTEEAYADIQKGFVGGALTGAIESIPSFLGGGKISRVIRLFAQAEDATMRDMENNPAFEGVSENEKRLVSAPISIATAILEEVGFRNVIASKGLLNGVVARALGKSGATTTARTFADFIRNDVDNMIARGALKLVGGALAEAETGALQQGVQLAVQKIYNEVKEKKMYKLPEDAGGVIADILRSGAQEAIGGFVLGMPSAVSAAYTKKGFLGMNDATFKAFEAAANDENIQKAFVTKLKNQVNQGEITIEQAKETLNNYRNSIGLFKSMPEGLDTQAKKEAMNLLKEKRDLENQTIGKDPALVKPLTDRINIINESLTKLSEDAVQEQATDESVLRTGEPQMGLQEVGEGNVQPEVVAAGTQEVAPEGTQEVDITSPLQLNASQSRYGITSNGNNVGFITTSVSDNNTVKIDGITVNEDSRGQGIAGDAYVKLGAQLAKNGLTLVSDNLDKIEPNALRVWDKLVAKGLAVKNDTNYSLLKEAVSSKTQPTDVQQEVTSMEEQFGKEFPTAPTTDQGVSVTNKSAVDNIKTKTTDKGRVKVIEAAQRVLKTLKSVLPNFDIVLHDDEGSYNAAMESLGNKQGQGTRGNFAIKRDGSGRIDINLSRANSRTVAHEVAHAVMAKAFNGTPALYKEFRDKISKVLSESSNKELMDFANNYTGDVTYEEYLAELTAVLEQQEGKIDTTTLQKIAAIINDIVSKITNGTFKPFEDIKDTKQVVDFFKSISESIRKGEEIDVSGMGAVKGFKAESKSQININKDEKQQGTAGPVAGNRLFNKPITKVKEIADGYYKRVFGTERPKFAGTRKLDEARGKRISDAFIAMKNNPNDPEVKTAYEALAKETLDQYKDFVKAGFTVEINNKERYNNSQEMIDDLRNNKTIKILSTESGFGSVPITEKERNNNPLLKDSGFKDINGNPLLINDVFRAIHDFYGHAELGNSFGVKGEENAWNVHARMFSPLARRAMTTETRGQNSYVNFSGVNERVEALREQARILREKGDEKGAKKIVDNIIKEEKFADQKIGLLPEEFSQFDEQDAGDVTMRPEGLQERDQEVPISKSQIVGERAMLSATANFNLNLAKVMFDNKMSPTSIRLATGWEKGKDGEWRYEIPDGKFKDIDINDLREEMDNDGKVTRVAKLSDVFTAPDLFGAYPDLKNMKVVFKNLVAKKGYIAHGSYDKYLKRINVNQKVYKENKNEAELTMLHEIQHYIQDKEFFETGSSDRKSLNEIKKAENDFKNRLDNVKVFYNTTKKLYPHLKQSIKESLELYNIIKEGYQKIKDLGKFKLNKKDKDAILKQFEAPNKFRKENDMPLLTLADALRTKVRRDAYNIYLRVAGEVEARNVETRNRLTPEQRKKTLLSETEDFDRQDQILFENKDFYLTKEYKEMDKEFPLSKSQVEVYHGTPHNVDKFSTSKIGTGEGNQAFGWGLYFTTLKSIAQHYANVLSGANNITVDGIGLKELLKKKGLEKNYKNATEDGNPNLNIWIKALTDVVADARTKSDALQNINEKIKEVEDNIEYANQKIKDKEFLADADIKMTESSLRGLNRMLQDYNFLYDSIRDVEDYKADTNKNVYEVSLHEGKKPSEYTWLEWDKPIKKDVRDRILERFTQEGYISKKDLNKLIDLYERPN